MRLAALEPMPSLQTLSWEPPVREGEVAPLRLPQLQQWQQQ